MKAHRNRLAILLAAICALLAAIADIPGARAQATIHVAARHALLMDADTGAVLFDKAADEPISPASLAKIMTAALVFRELKEGRLKLTDTMLVSESAWKRGGASAGGSTMFAKLHDRIAVEDLLRGLIVQSGNDAAIVLAEGIAGSEDAFAAMMSKRARELGLRDTTFRNAWGKFDPQQKTTARDLARLAIHVIKTYPDYYRYFGEREFTWNKIRQMNRNPLLTMDIGADGLKTGNIEDSGFSLVGSAVRDGQRLVVVLSGNKTARERAEEGRKLLNWGFRAFDTRDVYKPGDVIGTASVYGGDIGHVPLVSRVPVRVMVPRGSSDRLIARIHYIGPLIAPIQAGTKVARLEVTRGAATALDLPLYTKVDVATGTLHSRALDALLEYTGGLFRKYVLRTK